MATSSADLVGETGTYNTTGPVVDMGGTAATGHRTFPTAATDGDLTDGDTVYVLVKKDDSNMVVWEATWNDAATDHVDRVTELTAIGTLSNSDSVTVYIVNPSRIINSTNIAHESFICGAQLIYTDANTVQLGPGSAVIDGELKTWTSNITSGNLGQAAAGLSATGLWNWYLYDNAGTMTLEFTQTDPVHSTNKTFWHKSGDSSRRWVGWHMVHDDTGTREVMYLWASNSFGNLIAVNMEGDGGDSQPIRLVDSSTFTANTWTQITTGQGGTYTPADCIPKGPATKVGWKGAILVVTKNSGFFQQTLTISPYSTNNTAYGSYAARIVVDSATLGTNEGAFFPFAWMPCYDSDTWYYAVNEIDGTSRILIDVSAVEVLR